jgi:hypothetical protein
MSLCVSGNSQPGGRQRVLFLTIYLKEIRQLETNYLAFQAMDFLNLTSRFGTI